MRLSDAQSKRQCGYGHRAEQYLRRDEQVDLGEQHRGVGNGHGLHNGAVSSKNWLAGVAYDLNGNALAVNAFTLTYDVENRLATATSGSAVESHLYDESNHRVEKTIGSADYLYFYGPGGRLLSIRQIWAGTTSVVADRMYFGGLLLGSAGGGVWNDVSTLTDRLRTAAAGYPYGTDVGSVSAGNDQPDFATYTKDGTTGFEYANQRYYSAGLGRFMTPDPSGRNVRLGSPTTWNRFAYANQDPVNLTDPSGLCAGINLGVTQDAGNSSAIIGIQNSLGGAVLGFPYAGEFLEDALADVNAQSFGNETAAPDVAAASVNAAMQLSSTGRVTLFLFSGGAQAPNNTVVLKDCFDKTFNPHP